MMPFIPALHPFAPSILQTNEIPTAHAARWHASSIINGRCFVLFNAMVLISLFPWDVLSPPPPPNLLVSSSFLWSTFNPFFFLQWWCTYVAVSATRCFTNTGLGESGRHDVFPKGHILPEPLLERQWGLLESNENWRVWWSKAEKHMPGLPLSSP